MTAVTTMGHILELKGKLPQNIKYSFRWKASASSLKEVMATIVKDTVQQAVSAVELCGFEKIDLVTMKKLLRQSNDYFEVRLESIPVTNSYKVHLSLRSLSFSSSRTNLNESSDKKEPFISIVSIKYVHQLAPLCRELQDSLVKGLLKTMVQYFVNLPGLNQIQVKEIVSVARFLDPEDIKLVINKLLIISQLESSNGYLEELTEIMSFVQEDSCRANWRQANKEFFKATFPARNQKTLEIDDCVELMRLIEQIIKENLNRVDVVYYVRALVTLLELAINTQIEEEKLDQKEVCDAFLRKLNRFKKEPDNLIKFLAAYGSQNLVRNRTSEKVNHAMLRQLAMNWEVVAGDEAAPPIRPWYYFSNRSLLQSKQPQSGSLEKVWQDLSLIQNTYSADNSIILKDFNEFVRAALSQEETTFRQVEDALTAKQHFYFIEGLVELLRCFIDLHSHHTSFVQDAMQILVKIENDNVSLETTLAHFTLKKDSQNYRTHINERILTILEHYAESLNPPVAKIALESLKHLKGLLKPHRFNASEKQRCQIFEQSVQEHAPWISGLRSMKEYLEADPQIKELQRSTASVEAIASDGTRLDLFDEVPQRLGQCQSKAIFIKGHYGVGKSLFLKQMTLHYLNQYREDYPIPLFIALFTLKNPTKNFINETLERYQLIENKKYLQDHETVWFIDDFESVITMPVFFNFYQTNELFNWPKAKFVLTCQKDFLNEKRSIYFNPNYRIRNIGEEPKLIVQQLEVAPLTEEQQYKFLHNKYPELDLTNYKQLVRDLNFEELVSNPSFLKFFLEYCPECFRNVEGKIKISRSSVLGTLKRRMGRETYTKLSIF